MINYNFLSSFFFHLALKYDIKEILILSKIPTTYVRRIKYRIHIIHNNLNISEKLEKRFH